MYKKLLVPTDFSKESAQALDTALFMAKANNAEIFLLNIIEDPYSAVGKDLGLSIDTENQGIITKIEEKIEQKLSALISKLASKGMSVDFDIRVGNIFKAIQTYINEKQIDVVVMGSKGASGTDEILIGSITEKVVRHVDCPVITVKEKVDLTTIKSIVYPTDLKAEQEEVLRDLVELQKAHGAHLHVVKVYDSDFIGRKEIEEKMGKFAEHFQLENYSITALRYPDEADAILQFADSNDATLIAMATHNRKGLEVLFNTRISKNVVNHAKRPIWTKRVK